MTSAQPLYTNNQNSNNNSFSGYQIGGSLPLNASSYIERQADHDLYDLLKAGECCYVFNSRQMGKSSLRVRVTQRLKQDGIRCATIDPQTIGTQLEQSQWYASVISNLLESFGLEDRFDLEEWWESRDWSSPVLCLHDFITKFLLVEIKAPIVIFVEEVDSLLNLAFKADDFFMLIRSLNDNRSQNPEHRRLTFALVGVATPMDLIQHEKHSAFNIGKAVEMSGFSLAEAAPLAKGLENRFTEPQSILKNVLDWTGGQPFLTQKLLSLVSQYLPENLAAEQIAPEIAKIVETHIIHNWESQDKPPHLTTIRDRIVTVDEKLRGQMLDCYRRILEHEILEATTTTERIKLRLTGLVVKRDNNLRSYNPIYAAVFNQAWVAQQLTDLRPSFYAAAFQAWKDAQDGQNQGFLLRGIALENAEKWSRGKRLSDEDEEFLDLSRKEELTQERKKRSRIVRLLRNILIFLLTVAFIIVSHLAWQLKTGSDKLKISEINSLFNLSQASILANKSIESRLAFLSAYQKLAKIPDEEKNNLEFKLKNFKPDISEYNRYREQQISIRDVAFHPNGKIVASAGEKQIRLWNFDGSPFYNSYDITLGGFKDDISQIAFHPNGKLIAGSGLDGAIKIWDIFSRQMVASWEGTSGGRVNTLSFSQDGKYLASAGKDRKVNIWDVQSLKLLKSLPSCESTTENCIGHTKEIMGVKFSLDSSMIVSVALDRSLKLWDVKTFELLDSNQGCPELDVACRTGHNDGILTLDLSHDSKILVTGSADRQIGLWDTSNKKVSLISLINDAHRSKIRGIKFSHDDRFFATASEDSSIKLWSNKGVFIKTLFGHQGAVQNIDFSQQGEFLTSAGQDRIVRIWKLDQSIPTVVKAHNKNVKDVVFSPDGNLIATASDDESVNIWQIVSGNLVKKYHLESCEKDNPSCDPKRGTINLAFSPDGKSIVAGLMNGNIAIWNLQSSFSIVKPLIIKTHQDWVRGVRFSNDGRKLITVSDDGLVKIWDVQNNFVLIKKMERDLENWVLGLDTSPAEDLFATGDKNGMIVLWDIKGNIVRKWRAHTLERLSSVRFSHDGKMIASTSFDNTVRLWDLNGKLIREFKEHSHWVNSAAFSPDDQLIASGGYDTTVKIWNREGFVVKTFDGYGGAIFGVSFSPDGKWLIAVDNNVPGVARLWSLDIKDLQDTSLDTQAQKWCQYLRDYLVNNPNATDEEREACQIKEKVKR